MTEGSFQDNDDDDSDASHSSPLSVSNNESFDGINNEKDGLPP